MKVYVTSVKPGDRIKLGNKIFTIDKELQGSCWNKLLKSFTTLEGGVVRLQRFGEVEIVPEVIFAEFSS